MSDSIALPPNQPDVFLAGSTLVIFEQGTGELWILDVANLSTFDAIQDPSLSLGVGSVVSLDPGGLLFAYSPSAGLVYRANAAVSDVVDSTQSLGVAGSASNLFLTSVAGNWAVLDTRTQTLHLDGRTVELAGLMGAGGGPVLQWPNAAGDRIMVGFSGGLISVPLDGSAATTVVSGESGTAARPLSLEGCDFGAWTSGQGWRLCAGESEGSSLALASMTGTARLSFAANGTKAVLNDQRSGRTWAVQSAGELIDNWDDLIVVEDPTPEDQQNEQDVPPEVEKAQVPPVAKDDEFGARPGRATVLPVLLNDYDPNGDVLVVSDLAPIAETVGRIDLINERQQIQLTLAPGATGTVSFDYSVTDGRGGTDTATVTVTVHGADVNSPPKQERATQAVVQSGGRVTKEVLSDWVDPDGDPFY
ncbi:MAG: Ig-like domain-containing protein, partial [Rhodoglobus sp.]|nr:Ig-like domain-containing protein [Rhodoglobus sp.]